MERRDIPNLLNKTVRLVNLKTTSLNEQLGFVSAWNEERERYVVKLYLDNSKKLLKPANLKYDVLESNFREFYVRNQVRNLIYSESLKNFEQGMEIFNQWEEKEKYGHSFWKLEWLEFYMKYIAERDGRKFSKIRKVLKNIIKTCPFEDLIVRAKFNLVRILDILNENISCENLCMNSLKNHYGFLPGFFAFIVRNIKYKKKEIKQKFAWLQEIYFQIKYLISNKLYAPRSNYHFFLGIFELLKRWKPRKRMMAEVTWVRTEIELFLEVLDKKDFYYPLARACFWQKDFLHALENIEIYQKAITQKTGYCALGLSEIYTFRINCYIELGDKKSAERALKELKLFENKIENLGIPMLTKRIEKMKTNENLIYQNESQNIKTKTRCSAYDCERVESHLGAFQVCNGCSIKYYCSKKCQRHHWRNGHREECQQFEN